MKPKHLMKTEPLDSDSKGIPTSLVLLGMFLMLILLPPLGVRLSGGDIGRFLEFPPSSRFIAHARFSWPVFIGLACVVLAIILPFEIRVIRSRSQIKRQIKKKTPPSRPFPWWGRLGLLLGATAWVLSWTRFQWMEPVQLYTFTPPWLAYIVTVNALTFRRTGHCMLKDRPKYFLLLFPVSAAFWWFFEYLNRFVQNWYYVEAANLTKLEYFLVASSAFSTVLPAVLSTSELLKSFPKVGAGLKDFFPIRFVHTRRWAWIFLLTAAFGLAGIGLWPNLLFPLLWLAPLIIISSFMALCNRETLIHKIQSGDWSRIYRLALAALICGLFWEMWNFYSLAKWIYTVPYVGDFKLFEMPLLGYFGYLPFGLECGVIGDLLSGRRGNDG